MCPIRSRAIVLFERASRTWPCETGERRRLALPSGRPRTRRSGGRAVRSLRQRRGSVGDARRIRRRRVLWNALGGARNHARELHPGAHARGRHRRPAGDRDRQLAGARGRDGGRHRVPETDPRSRAHPPRDPRLGARHSDASLRHRVRRRVADPHPHGLRCSWRRPDALRRRGHVRRQRRVEDRSGDRPCRASQHRHGHQSECRDRLVVCVTAEFFVGTAGVGAYMLAQQAAYQLPQLYAAAALAGLVGVAIDATLRTGERRALFWVGEERGRRR